MSLTRLLKKLLKKNHTYRRHPGVKWFGTEYGGFYLDESRLKPGDNLFSFGVGEDISFDISVSKIINGPVYLFDPTPKSIAFVRNESLPPHFSFQPIGISDKDERADFFLPKNENNVSGSLSMHKQLDADRKVNVELKKLASILSQLAVKHINILKMDIEGNEYKVLGNIIGEKIFPDQICIEFHNDFFHNGQKMFDETLQILKSHSYEVFGISSSGKEFLFVRTDKDV